MVKTMDRIQPNITAGNLIKHLRRVPESTRIVLSIGLPDFPGNIKNPKAVAEVLSGKRTVANAAWWGFDKTDSTRPLQRAIDSCAKRIIVPAMDSDWITQPLRLQSNQEIIFEEGVRVIAKSNRNLKVPIYFRSTWNSCLFTAEDKTNIILRGYGATVQMNKLEYMAFPEKWQSGIRHCLRFNGCSNIQILGLTIKDSGGSGITLLKGKEADYCSNVLIKDVDCDGNHGDGIGIVSVDGLLIENVTAQNTAGSELGDRGPASGIDFEPWYPESDILRNIVVRNSVAENNAWRGINISLAKIKPSEVSILFEDCIVRGNHGKQSVYVAYAYEDCAYGLIRFKNIQVEGGLYGAGISTKTEKVFVEFDKCSWSGVNPRRGAYPLLIYRQKGGKADNISRMGGVGFRDCKVFDNQNRPCLKYTGEVIKDLYTVRGNLCVHNPRRQRDFLNFAGAGLHDVNLVATRYSDQF